MICYSDFPSAARAARDAARQARLMNDHVSEGNRAGRVLNRSLDPRPFPPPAINIRVTFEPCAELRRENFHHVMRGTVDVTGKLQITSGSILAFFPRRVPVLQGQRL